MNLANHRLVVFACSRSAGEALAALEGAGKALPADVEWVSLPCGGGVDVLHILRALEAGAEQVWVLACYDGACESLEGNRWAEKRVREVQRLLGEIGLAPERVLFRPISPTMAADLAVWLEER